MKQKKLITGIMITCGALFTIQAQSQVPEERHAHRQRLLERFDLNENGVLDADERKAVHESGLIGKRRGPHRNRISPEFLLEQYDTDNDGELNQEERAAIRHENRDRRGRARRSQTGFERGKAEEEHGARKGRRHHRGRHQKLLEEFDADQNGEIDEDERITARESIRERRHRN